MNDIIDNINDEKVKKHAKLIEKLIDCIEIKNSENNRLTIVFKRKYGGLFIDKLESMIVINSNIILNKPDNFKFKDRLIKDVQHIIKQVNYYEKGGYITKNFFIIDVDKESIITFLLNFILISHKKDFKELLLNEELEHCKIITIYILNKIIDEPINIEFLNRYLNIKAK